MHADGPTDNRTDAVYRELGASVSRSENAPREDDRLPVIRRSPLEEAHSRLAFNVEAYGTAWTGEMADTEFIVRPLIDEADRLREALKRIAAGEARPSHIAGKALDDAR